MKLIPTQRFLTAVKCDVAPDNIVLPEGASNFPHFEVRMIGPECKFVKPGDLIFCLPNNVMGFEGHDEFIIQETAIFALGRADNIVTLQ